MFGRVHVKLFVLILLTGLLLPASAPGSLKAAPAAYDCAAAEGLSSVECEALVALYDATDGDRWNDRSDWLQTMTPCSWYGVDCEDGHVTRLLMDNNGLQGFLPSEIGNLSALNTLSFYNDALTSLPAEIGNLTALATLNLDHNDLITLPVEIGDLTSLLHLHLSNNALTALPSQFGNLTSLWDLDLSNNALTALPPEIGDFTQLAWIFANDNALTAIPEEIGNITHMDYLYLHNNPLSGEMPDSLTSLTQLKAFTFYATDWCVPEEGDVPTWLETVWAVHGTGLICEQDPGGMGGTATLPDGMPIPGIQVNLYRPVEEAKWHYVASAQTTASGTYQFSGLGQGIDYRVQFVDPARQYVSVYYGDQKAIEQATPVTVTLGMTRTGIDVRLVPVAVELVKSVTPVITVGNGSRLIYTLAISTNVDSLHLYDPLDEYLSWIGFVDDAPETLGYADGALTGTVSLSAGEPLSISFAVRVNVPESSFVGGYAQVANTAYYFLDETFVLDYPSNTVVSPIDNRPIFTVFLPAVLRVQ